MDNALGVRRSQPAGNLFRVIDGLYHRKLAAFQATAERFALEQFGDEIGFVPIAAANVVNRQDVGMIERAGGLRFDVKAPQQLVISYERRQHQLDRDIPIQPRVTGAENCAHAAGTDEPGDLVRADSRADGDGHSGGEVRWYLTQKRRTC